MHGWRKTRHYLLSRPPTPPPRNVAVITRGGEISHRLGENRASGNSMEQRWKVAPKLAPNLHGLSRPLVIISAARVAAAGEEEACF